jgi:hypothetical protein
MSGTMESFVDMWILAHCDYFLGSKSNWGVLLSSWLLVILQLVD